MSGRKKLIKECFDLDREVYTTSVTAIEEEIRKKEVALEHLKEQQRNGVFVKSHRTRANEIDGIPINYRGKNKKQISLATDREKHPKRYDYELIIVLHWLKNNGYKPAPFCVCD